MEPQYTQGFDSFGFLIPNQNDAISQLIGSAWEAATPYPSLEGETRLLQCYYSSLWLHSSNGSVSSIMETGRNAGMVASIDSLPSRKHMMVSVGNIHDQSPSSLLRPFYIQCAQPWLQHIQPTSETLPLSLTISASSAVLFPDKKAFVKDSQFGQYPAEYNCPTALGNGESQTQPLAFACGKVLLAVQATNNFTNNSHWALRVKTMGGKIWVNLPISALEDDPTSQIIAVQGLISGSFPSLTPPPLSDIFVFEQAAKHRCAI